MCLLKHCDSSSKNFSDLRTLANSEYKIFVRCSDEVMKTEGIYQLGDDFDSNNKGETLLPGIPEAKSPNENLLDELN